MKRINIQAAFVGEPNAMGEGLEAIGGDEAALVLVRGGELTIVVPPGTPDDRITTDGTYVRGALHLENGRIMNFEINQDAVGAFFEDQSIELYRQQSTQTSGDLFTASSPLFAQSAAISTPVRAIMAPDPVTVRSEITLRELAEILVSNKVSGVPVVDDHGKLIGIVTESDIIARTGATVGELMTQNVVWVPEDRIIAEVAALMSDRRIRRMPVVRDGHIVGVVSQSDIVRWLAEMGA